MAMALDREREREPDKKVLVVTYTPVPTADRHGAAITALCKALARHVAVDLVGVKDAEPAEREVKATWRASSSVLSSASPAAAC